MNVSKGRYECTACGCDFHDHCCNLACPVAWHYFKSTGLGDAKSIDAEGIPDPLERRSSKSFELGLVSKLEDLPARFLERAGQAFAAGQDEKANMLRDIAKELAKEGSEARSKWSKKYGPTRPKEK